MRPAASRWRPRRPDRNDPEGTAATMYAAEHAKNDPDKPAIIMATSGQVVTYGEFEAGANRVAHLLRDTGLVRGDHMAIFMENDARMLLTEGGAERTGLYYTCINSYLSVDEVAYVVNDSLSKVVVTSFEKAEVARQLPPLCPGVERWLMLDAPAGGDGPFESWDEAVAAYPSEPIEDEQLGLAMLYSSGTTGRPKGIIRPLPETTPSEALPVSQGLRILWRFREEMVYLSPAPLYHSAPQASVANTLRLGATAVVMERFDAAQFFELVGRYKVTHSQVVPTMFSRMLKLPAEVREAADVSSLEVIVHAAAPCPVPVKQQMIEWFGPILLEYYAATEGNGFTIVDSDDWMQHKGTVGRALGAEVLILDEDGNPCPTGTPGTVWFKGATNFE
ncbi:MAG: AMP-binding protein, partial [Acidimicrobiales bacterium]